MRIVMPGLPLIILGLLAFGPGSAAAQQRSPNFKAGPGTGEYSVDSHTPRGLSELLNAGSGVYSHI